MIITQKVLETSITMESKHKTKQSNLHTPFTILQGISLIQKYNIIMIKASS